jgi:hypothetical protein
MKTIKDFLTGVAKEQTTQFLSDNGLVTANDKGTVTLAQIRKALATISDDDLEKLAEDFGFDANAEPADSFMQDLAFTPEERGIVTAKDGTKIAVINCVYENRSSKGTSVIFSFSKGFVTISASRILELARSGKMVKGKSYPIKADSFTANPNAVGYFYGVGVQSGFEGMDDLYLEKADKSADLKIALKDLRDQGTSEEQIETMLYEARKTKLVGLV